MFQRILIATDFSDFSSRAVALGLEIARRFDAEVTLVHAYDVPAYVYTGIAFTPADMLTPIEEGAREALKIALADAKAVWPKTTSVLMQGAAAEQILAAAKETKADLVVLGTHGRRGVTRALIGSVAEKVVRYSSIPVLTTRG